MRTKKVRFMDTTRGKTLKVAIYVGISALLGYLITALTDQPELWGGYSALVNIVLVAVKNLIDKNIVN